MKKMKRIISTTLACLMAGVSTIGMSSCDFGNSSEGPTVRPNSEGLEYTLNADGASYSVTGIGTCTDTDVVIPATYEGLPVTSIGDSALDYCLDLTSVVIPDSVTSIGACAFEYSYGLRSIVIGDGVGIPNLHPFKNNGVF